MTTNPAVPHHISLAGSDRSMCWTYSLHFPGVSTKDAVATISSALTMLYAEFDPNVQKTVVGIQVFHRLCAELCISVVVNNQEEKDNFPIYRQLQQLLNPVFHFTALHRVSVGNDQTCKVAFRIPGSLDDEGVENHLIMGAKGLGFSVRSQGLSFIVGVSGGTTGYGRLVAMFASHSVYLPPLTPEERFDLR